MYFCICLQNHRTRLHYNHLEQKSIAELLTAINSEDQTVPKAVENALPQIERLVENVVQQLQLGGRLFYLVQEQVGVWGFWMPRNVRRLLAFPTT